MSPDSPLTNEKRTRVGLVFLVAGTLLVVWAWGSWIFRTAEAPAVPGEVVNSGASGHATGGGGMMAAAVFAVVVGLAVVGYLFLRRFRRGSAIGDPAFGSPDDSNDHHISQDPGRNSE